eukprot:6195725-Pleurochrysis_carterae.AAC.12
MQEASIFTTEVQVQCNSGENKRAKANTQELGKCISSLLAEVPALLSSPKASFYYLCAATCASSSAVLCESSCMLRSV